MDVTSGAVAQWPQVSRGMARRKPAGALDTAAPPNFRTSLQTRAESAPGLTWRRGKQRRGLLKVIAAWTPQRRWLCRRDFLPPQSLPPPARSPRGRSYPSAFFGLSRVDGFPPPRDRRSGLLPEQSFETLTPQTRPSETATCITAAPSATWSCRRTLGSRLAARDPTRTTSPTQGREREMLANARHNVPFSGDEEYVQMCRGYCRHGRRFHR